MGRLLPLFHIASHLIFSANLHCLLELRPFAIAAVRTMEHTCSCVTSAKTGKTSGLGLFDRIH